MDNLANDTVNGDIAGSSSPTNTWFFPQASSSTRTKTLGLVWNGSAWQTVPVPGVASGASVVSASDMWAVGPTTATAGKALGRQDLEQGGRGHRDRPEYRDHRRRGRGPLAVRLRRDHPDQLPRHYSGGTFTAQAVPSETGYDGVAGQLAQVPGGTSVWGIGSLQPTGNGIPEGDILRYGG